MIPHLLNRCAPISIRGPVCVHSFFFLFHTSRLPYISRGLIGVNSRLLHKQLNPSSTILK